MKNRTKDTGSLNDDWETPKVIYNFIETQIFKNKDYFDPCPLKSSFNGLDLEWKQRNYINPPYNRFDKPKFIKKCYQEYLKGKICVLLIPATTDTIDFHKYIVPYAKIYLIKNRVAFKGINTKGVYVTNKKGQSGSMLCIFDKNIKPSIETLDLGL